MLFKQRKNKIFSYTPKFSKETKESSNQEENSRYGDFASKWRETQSSKRKLKGGMKLSTLILVLVLLLLCMYLLEKKYI